MCTYCFNNNDLCILPAQNSHVQCDCENKQVLILPNWSNISFFEMAM